MIVVKPYGVKAMPKFTDLARSFSRNPDGAGIMASKKGENEVRFVKGLMTFSEFIRAYEEMPSWQDPESYAIAIHFRLATHGGEGGKFCHPFPISKEGESEMKKLRGTSVRMAMHNGVLSDSITGITKEQRAISYSDTMAFVENILSEMDGEEIKSLEGQIGYNKIVVMGGDAELSIVNRGMGETRNGIWFSNRL